MNFLKENYRVLIVFGIPIVLIALFILFSKYNPFNIAQNKSGQKGEVAFVNPKKEFTRDEVPEFTVLFPSNDSKTVGKQTKDDWVEKGGKMLVSLFNKFTGQRIPAYIQKQTNNKFKVIVANPKEAKYGLYTIQVDATTDFKFERNLSQDFAWGVLAVNTNKSMYLPNEKAKLGFGVLDERGNTLCNADLTVEISNPDKKIQKFDTSNGGITRSPKCIGNTYSLDDDYYSFYNTGKEGRYYINLTAHTKNGAFTISDYFEVKNTLPYEVERTQFPTRIYPVESYPVKLTVKANQDYKGQVYDLVPIDFQITNISGNGTVSRTKNSRLSQEELIAALKDEAKHLGEKDYKIKYNPEDISKVADKTPVEVMWDVDWKKGKTYTLTYSIYFPQVSPEYYLLGPFTIGNFKEVREWQVASDATKCWDGGGANNNWNTAANWASDTNPTTTSNATFHGASCTAGTPDKSVTVNVDPTLTGTGGGITLSSNYTGTMTQSSGVTMSIYGTIGFVMAGGTFVGSDSLIDTTIFNHTGGTFTSTTGTLSFQGNFTNSGGTFTNNSGTVYMSDGGSTTYTFTGSTTLYNFSLYGAANNGVTLAIASGTTITVNNTLTLQSDDFCGPLLGINGPGGISAKGDVTLVNDGANGSATITLNGTGSQTIAGDGSAPVFNGCSSSHVNQLPNININKTSGTTTLQNYLVAANWTYTSGSIITTGSTLIFAAGSVTNTLTGSMEFDNVKFYSQCNNGGTFVISSGTNLLIRGDMTFLSDTGCIGNVNGPGTLEVQGNVTSTGDAMGGDVPITFSGSNDQTVTLVNSSFPSGNVTINKSAGTVTAASNLPFSNTGQTLTITSGVLNMGTKNLTVNGLLTINGQLIQTTGSLTASSGITVGSKGVWANNSTGSITLGGNVSNSGYIHLDGGGPTCGDNDVLSIRSSSNGTVRSWSGSGTTYLADLDVKDQSAGSYGSAFETASGTSLTVGPFSVDNGDLLIAVVGGGTTSSTFSMSDSVGTNTWSSAVPLQVDTPNGYSMQTFYAKNVNGSSSMTVTATFTPASGWKDLIVVDVKNIDTTNPLDKTAHSEADAGTAISVGPVTTTANGEFIFAAAQDDSGTNTISSNSPFSTITTSGDNTNFYYLNAQQYVQPTAGSITPGWTMTGTDNAMTQMATFKNNGSTPSIAGVVTAYSSTNTGNNLWTFNSGCPAYSNRTSSKLIGGSKITGGTKIKSY